jgi:hypothetical protein
MDRVTSNADEVAAWIEGVVAGFDFTLPGEQGSLGEDLAGVAAQGMIDRGVPDARAADGGNWAPNEARYAAYKRRRFGAIQPGILTGQMLSLESMLGRPEITPDRVEMTYGTGEPAAGSRSGAPLRPSDQEVTDREKASYFTDSGRRFYELDDTIAAAVVEKASEAWDRYLDREGR